MYKMYSTGHPHIRAGEGEMITPKAFKIARKLGAPENNVYYK